MNVILLEPGETRPIASDPQRSGGPASRAATGEEGPPDGVVRLTGRRHEHVRDRLRARVGDVLRVGEVGGALGDGQVRSIDRHATDLEIRWVPSRALPPASEMVLAFAMPRPPTFRKVLSQATAMGVKRFEVFAASRVERSYWDSHVLERAAIGEVLRLGLEQSGDTAVPVVRVHRKFRPFAEDVLGVHTPCPVLVADPTAERPCPRAVGGSASLVIGPEGGFVPFELECFARAGHEVVQLGPRVMRVETAVVAALGRLSP